MKKAAKFISIFTLTTLYCIAIGFVTQSLASYNIEKISTAKEVKFLYKASNNFFTQTSHTENVVDIPRNNSNFPSTLKNIFENFKAPSTFTTQHSILSLNSNYYSTYINFLVQFKKLKLIFPFHYFL